MGVRTAGAVLLMAAVLSALDAPLAEYEKRRTALVGELADEHCALGTWCTEKRFSDEARQHFREALELHPGLIAAQRALTRLGQDAPGVAQKCELSLRNGERVRAGLNMSVLCLETDSGVLFVPPGEVHLILLGADDGPDVVVADTFYGEARLLHDTFAVTGKIGSVEASRRNLSGIRLFHPCPACNGRIEWKCARCGGAGRVTETTVCPKCKGKGQVKCNTCKGRGQIRCQQCQGKGFNWGTYGGLRARFHCTTCKHTGKLTCPDCQSGGVECPDCMGEPTKTKEIVCPECKGEKILRCTVCKGTGVKPLPPDVEKELTQRGTAPTEK
ncbi:MAG TPA: hypothetical protein VMZ92_03470 [Planctomycetota bacterium]|nr:hypothetical protein [Planctomycetota bacterium]